MENLKLLSVNELIAKLKALKQRNRDLLTVEDINSLDECISRLEEPPENPESNESMIIQVTLTLLKWLTEINYFDL